MEDAVVKKEDAPKQETIQPYYFATYAKAGVEFTQIDPTKRKKSTKPLDDITFYDKTFYCAHLRPSTHERITDPEDLVRFATSSQEERRPKTKLLSTEEWVEDLSESTLVCLDPTTSNEVDAYDYCKSKGFECESSESGIIKYASWCDQADLP